MCKSKSSYRTINQCWRSHKDPDFGVIECDIGVRFSGRYIIETWYVQQGFQIQICNRFTDSIDICIYSMYIEHICKAIRKQLSFDISMVLNVTRVTIAYLVTAWCIEQTLGIS